jgi:ubiquinone/menaquinone biosynthesis C-methylase UbiE
VRPVSTIARVRRRILTRVFDLLYGMGAWVYDPLTTVFFGPEWHRWRRTVLPSVSPGPVLEIGCGTGRLLSELQQRAGFAVGLDLSASMLRAANRRRTGNYRLVRADGTRLPFRDSSFQTVVSTFPASYIARASTLDEISRVLDTGGQFVVVVSARFDRFQWPRPFIHPILRLAYGSTRSMNRWPDDLLAHSDLPGAWHDLPTKNGTAFVWIAEKREGKVDVPA